VKLKNQSEIVRLCQTTETALNFDRYTKEYMTLRAKYGPVQMSRREYLEREAATVGLQLPKPTPEDLVKPTFKDDKDTTKWR